MTEDRESNQVVGGRIFFSGADRSLVEEDEIRLISIGVDIGSSTAHLMFSRITLERLDTRYIVSNREVIYASDIFLTPYADNHDIDTEKLSDFIDSEYAKSGVKREDVDTGALILTGVAVRRRNARAIGELFAGEAGKFVSVSAGDSLETVMAAHGSGAVEASRGGKRILNIDVGGGTTKLAVCEDGEVRDLTAIEAGARLVATDAAGTITRLEQFGALALGDDFQVGQFLPESGKREMADLLADRIFHAIDGTLETCYRRLEQLTPVSDLDGIIVSGGVSEYFYEHSNSEFGDIGPALAAALRQRIERQGLKVLPHRDGIRATVVGASQYTVQVSGSTVFLDPITVLPLKNTATIRPQLDLQEEISIEEVAKAVALQLAFYNLDMTDQPVAVALKWQGSASYHRLDALTRGLVQGMLPVLEKGHPLTIVTDGDFGGLLGMHCRENGLTANAIVSIDGIELEAFDFIDIGEIINATGSVPVVIKSLIFPGELNAEPKERAA